MARHVHPGMRVLVGRVATRIRLVEFFTLPVEEATGIDTEARLADAVLTTCPAVGG